MGAEPLVLLCNGAGRSEFRHPLPTHSPIGGGRWRGLRAAERAVANVTRWVRFDAGHPRSRRRSPHRGVEADIFGTVPGARLNEVFAEIREAYVRHGFGAAQWTLHHQGGPAGYAGRDPRATRPRDTVVPNQAFTWNPSGPG